MRGDRERLLDVLRAIEEIDRYAARGRESFDRDELVQAWIVQRIQIIGEACRGLSPELLRAHPEVPWRDIVGMRNVLVHGYFQVDLDAVWAVAENDLDRLRRQVRAVVGALESG